MSLAVKVRDRSEPVAPRWRLTLPELWAFVAIALPVVASLAARLSTVDLAYQIRAGSIILATHAVPRVDTFTFTVHGKPWLDQQWGSQLLLALWFRAGGWATLILLRAALIGATFSFVYASCRAVGAGRRRAAGLTIASFAVAAPALNLRPQLFAIALFAFAGWIVVRRKDHPGWLWGLPPLTAVWANLHGSFFLVLVLLALAWLEDRKSAPAIARRIVIVAGLSLLATLATPFGIRVWTYVYDISTNPVITKFISEWEPPTVRNYAGAAFFISVAAVAAVLARRIESVRWTALTTLVVFFAIALQAQRGIVWWALTVPVVLTVIMLSQPFSERPPKDVERRLVNSAIAAVLVAIGVILAPWWRTLDPPGGPGGILSFAPPHVTEHLAAVVQPGDRIFSTQAWASWFEFRFRREPVAVDARIEIFPASVWQDYTNVVTARQGWQALLDRWHVDVVVLSREQGNLLIPIIAGDPRWTLAFEDSDGVVYVRAPVG